MSDKADLLMKIVLGGGGGAIPGESRLAIDTTDQLLEGFAPGKFFQIKDFTFSAGLQDDQGAGGGGAGGAGGTGAGGAQRAGVFAVRPANAPYGGTREALARLQSGQGKDQGRALPPAAKQADGKSGENRKRAGGRFAKWRAGAGGARYPLEVEPIGFTRIMDRASTKLLQALCDSQSLASASIVRRTGAVGDKGAQAFLRLDFTDVLITEIDWDDDEDTIEEKFKFICRGVQVRFRPQNSDGSLGAPVSGVWPAK